MHEFTLPIGPQHPALAEPIHFRLKVDGETVVDAEMHLGYNHRGIEKALEGRQWFKGVFLSGRICGICSQSHTACYSQGIEKLARVEVPDRGKYSRTIFAELERMHSHMLLLAVAGHTIGFDTAFHYIWRDREYVLEIMELLSGKRIQHDFNTVGGVRWDVSEDHVQKINRNLDRIEQRARHYHKIFTKDRAIRKRMKGVGKLSASDAREFGVVGPIARASGLNTDLRTSGYSAYGHIDFRPVVGSGGDCLERFLVRLKELRTSVKIIRDCMANLPAGECKARLPLVLNVEKGKEATSRIEAPRGELIYYIKSSGLTPERVKIRTPTLANFSCVGKILQGVQVADAPITIASLDPCIACCDRMTIVDINTGKEQNLDHHELDQLRNEGGSCRLPAKSFGRGHNHD
jgi:Ni,Fe-hydrogenase III large subunit